MAVIMVLVLAMLSPVQAIIAAEAGANARAENIAVVIKILIRTLPENETSILLANEIRFRRPKRFQRNKFLCAAMQRNPVSRNELAIAENKGGLNANDLDSRRGRGCGFLQRGVCPNRRRQRHQRWRCDQVGLGCIRAREHDCQGRHGKERKENDEEKEGVIDTVTALAMCLAARRS
jgi:hypothetical protein